MNIPTSTTPESEFWARIVHPYYNPRRNPLKIPAVRWDESPCWCLSVNEHWAGHILALLDLLDQWDTWQGTNEEIFAARIQVNELIACFVESSEMCCCGGNDQNQQTPVLHRVTSDGQLQVSYDGGITWETDPNDPRVTGTTLPPPVVLGGSVTKCDAATNGLEHLKDAIAAVSESLGAGATLVGVMAAIATFIVTLMFASPEVFPAIFPLVIALATAAFGIGQAAFDAAFTNTVWDAMVCILFCHIGEDGHFTEGTYAAVLADIPVKITDPTASFQLGETIKAMGLNGLNNICSYGNASLSDCAACECAGCDLSDWIIYNDGDIHGVIREQTTGSITVEASLNSNGSYYAVIVSPDDNTCCEMIGEFGQWVSGSFVPDNGGSAERYYNNCGEPINLFSPHPVIGENFCGRMVEWVKNTPFSVRWTSTDTNC